jgi:hypothetical protein
MSAPAHWPGRADFALERCTEAGQTADRLGHRLTDWLQHEGTLRARCMHRGCDAAAIVRPRNWHGAPLGGPALYLRCK